ncbi:MAG: DUF3108 domain-containing protein [Gammaproteobacteria bacterium]
MEIRSTQSFTSAISVIIITLTAFLTPVSSASLELPHEFSAKYALEMFGTIMARARYTLEHTENGLSMTQSTRPAGLVALLRDDKIDVRSDMIIRNGQILLVKYDYKHTGDDKDRDVNFRIDWQPDTERGLVGKAIGVYEGKNVDIDIDTPVWDPLSIQVPIMIDTDKHLPPHEHGLFMKGEFKHYVFENHGSEKIVSNGKQFDAIKIAGKETKRDRAMYVWLVPELHNLPIKIEQWKEGQLKSTVHLEKVSFNEGDETRTLNFSDDPADYD